MLQCLVCKCGAFYFMKKKTKIIIISIISFITVLALVIAIPFTILAVKTNNLKKDYSYLKNDNEYNEKVEVTGINLVTQHISCGYATIEMMSEYYGNKVTEDDLNKKNNGGVSTSSTDGFYKEIKSCINKEFVKKTYLPNDEYLKELYRALKNDNPIAIEWAALYENEWTLHFSLVTSLDIANDKVTIYNPYGYIENIDIQSFIDRTTFNAYKRIPLFLNFGFAFGAFHKNTLFYAK